jgi:L-asparaginase/Glu-tRNA(Gln) amidotransferase subunit D
LKQKGKSCREISELLKINYKTIQSVNKPEKNQEYQSLMRKVEQMAHENIVGKTNYKVMILKIFEGLKSKVAEQDCEENSQGIVWSLIEIH